LKGWEGVIINILILNDGVMVDCGLIEWCMVYIDGMMTSLKDWKWSGMGGDWGGSWNLMENVDREMRDWNFSL
jgi:hypothetical protein